MLAPLVQIIMFKKYSAFIVKQLRHGLYDIRPLKSNLTEKFGGIQHFCLMEKNWLLHVLCWPIHKSSGKWMFD